MAKFEDPDLLVKPYQDPDHPWNSKAHHTGSPCIEVGCAEPAGTAWSPHWCFKHNVLRMDRIAYNLDKLSNRLGNKG